MNHNLNSQFFRSLLLCLGFTFSTLAFPRDGFTLNFWQPSVNQPLLLEQVERASQLGATHFNLPVLLCQDHKDSVQIQWCYTSGPASPLGLLELGKTITSRGFTLGFLPLVIGRDGSWRGHFAPSNFETWGASYTERLTELVPIVRETRAQELIVGSEFNGLYLQENFWRQLLTRLRVALPGVALFAVANWDQVERISFWDACDYIALSAYFPLALRGDKNLSVQKLTQAWGPWKTRLLDLAHSHRKSLYFAEVGYRSVDNAAAAPWESAEQSPLNLALQATLYKTLTSVWANQAEVRRLMIWWLSPSAQPTIDTGYDILGKPAETEVSIMMHQSKSRP